MGYYDDETDYYWPTWLVMSFSIVYAGLALIDSTISFQWQYPIAAIILVFIINYIIRNFKWRFKNGKL